MPFLLQLRVMVADPSPGNRRRLADCLISLGIADVVETGDGEQVFAALVASPFDAVFTASQLQGLGGAQLLKALRGAGATRRCRVILIAGPNGPGTEAEGKALGFDAVLARPFTATAVKAALESVLGRLS